MAREKPPAAITRLRDLAANLPAIIDADECERKERPKHAPNLMRRFMEEIITMPPTVTGSSLLPMDLDEEEQLFANKDFTIATPSRSLITKPFETYTYPFIRSRLLEMFLGKAHHEAWSFGFQRCAWTLSVHPQDVHD
ncbi:hypothetical protein GOP47_0009742 [Adiantum capillus-veneris]|uniref:Uncharacterized protein n=1 Tax=Adiantum capillus-veneris TaxID=13818 RepID=A0A9D4UXE3_ADICA|nr:hypothetical protein GOP47_0009742 [Adiantum capillus-veneris]